MVTDDLNKPYSDEKFSHLRETIINLNAVDLIQLEIKIHLEDPSLKTPCQPPLDNLTIIKLTLIKN